MNARKYILIKNVILSLFGLLLASGLTSALTMLLELNYRTILVAAVVIICVDGFSLVFLARGMDKAEQQWKGAHPGNQAIRIDEPFSRFRTTARRDIAHKVQSSLIVVGIVIIFASYGDSTAMWTGVSLCFVAAITNGPAFYHYLLKARKKNQTPD